MNKVFWRTIGLRRTRNFVIVLLLNAAFAAFLFLYQIPVGEQATLDLAQAEQRKLDIQNQIVELPKKFEQMQKNEAIYDELSLRGFFADQDRIAFRQILDDLRLRIGVRQVAYDIKPQMVVENAALSNTDKQLLKSEILVTLKSATDMEIREFVHTLQDLVPGISTIKQQSFTRGAELNDENLISLGNGEPIDFVDSSYSFDWYTLSAKKDPLGLQSPADGMGGLPGVPVDPTQPTAIPAVVPTTPVIPGAASPTPGAQ
jgi:hypothetical protein